MEYDKFDIQVQEKKMNHHIHGYINLDQVKDI